jgi:hypothetical protein
MNPYPWRAAIIQYVCSLLTRCCMNIIIYTVILLNGYAVAHLVEATNRKVVGFIPESVIGKFHWHNPSGRAVTLGLTKPLTEMNTRNNSRGRWVNAAGAQGWQPYHLHVPIVFKSGSLSLLEPSRPVMGLLYLFILLNSSNQLIVLFEIAICS